MKKYLIALLTIFILSACASKPEAYKEPPFAEWNNVWSHGGPHSLLIDQEIIDAWNALSPEEQDKMMDIMVRLETASRTMKYLHGGFNQTLGPIIIDQETINVWNSLDNQQRAELRGTIEVSAVIAVQDLQSKIYEIMTRYNINQYAIEKFMSDNNISLPISAETRYEIIEKLEMLKHGDHWEGPSQ